MAHIGIDARITDYRIGGISTYARQLIAALAAQISGDQLTVFQSRRMRAPVDDRLTTRRLLTPPHHRIERSALSLELLRHRLDLLHSVDFIPPHRGARRHVITVHDLTFLHYPQHKDRAARRYYNDQIAWAVRRADHILAVSEATRQDLITMLSVPADRITVQPHGVDPRYQPQSVEAVRLLGLPNTYLLHVGTLEPRKNIPALLDAYTRLDDPPPLVLAGQVGWLFDETLARIKQMQADHVPVILRDDIADAALPALYSGALALVIPSFYEGFGLPALEAMACGTPVIASNTSSLPEVVGDAGRLIDPQDVEALAGALRVATTDAGWRGEASTRGLARAAAFTWARSARIALDVYHRVLES